MCSGTQSRKSLREKVKCWYKYIGMRICYFKIKGVKFICNTYLPEWASNFILSVVVFRHAPLCLAKRVIHNPKL